jgi:hypothetical protein
LIEAVGPRPSIEDAAPLPLSVETVEGRDKMTARFVRD